MCSNKNNPQNSSHGNDVTANTNLGWTIPYH